MPRRRTDDEFWGKVDRSDGTNACWRWMGATDGRGYGSVRIGNRLYKAHRIAMKLSGIDPDGLMVLHLCDNPPCCNPAHLQVGTQRDNMEDCARKGRTAKGARSGAARHPERVPRGTRVGGAKLTDDIVQSVRRMRVETGATQAKIANIIGVNQAQVSRILSGKAWRHVLPMAIEPRATQPDLFK